MIPPLDFTCELCRNLSLVEAHGPPRRDPLGRPRELSVSAPIGNLPSERSAAPSQETLDIIERILRPLVEERVHLEAVTCCIERWLNEPPHGDARDACSFTEPSDLSWDTPAAPSRC